MKWTLRRQLSLPRPPASVALGIVVLWSICLCILDVGARVRARRPFVLVKEAGDCDRLRSPEPEQIVSAVEPRSVLWVRNWGQGKDLTCYLFEDLQGRRGWAPYNSAYMASHGVGFRLRRF